ncbi:GNAT family N-acetyltransferase [Roseicella frigidaeris]|uniref:GNAT family N-acetyltransferase n=1 Tax=Roseicella frigidaeris TaxID=2230885 RepID=A0A327MBT3_9PROT|nr:GNAT family N-acetyltransferase [Roseicella frigidaeris]RAI60037.1 GNAT family N-acetyltransferase [Roseicella frigidaeris]
MTSRHGLELRAATAADMAGLHLLLSAGGHAMAAPALAARLDALRQGAGAALVALEWGPPSGVLALHWYRTLLSDRPVAQIDLLLVGAEDQRRGIGRLLVEAAAQLARNAGCGAMDIVAADDQASMRAFCHALGFLPTGPRFRRALRKGR